MLQRIDFLNFQSAKLYGHRSFKEIFQTASCVMCFKDLEADPQFLTRNIFQFES